VERRRLLDFQLGRGLIPGDDFGAVALTDALDQGAPLLKLLRRGDRRLSGSCRLAHISSIRQASTPGLIAIL
jgi:hypothetical protein